MNFRFLSYFFFKTRTKTYTNLKHTLEIVSDEFICKNMVGAFCATCSATNYIIRIEYDVCDVMFQSVFQSRLVKEIVVDRSGALG